MSDGFAIVLMFVLLLIITAGTAYDLGRVSGHNELVMLRRMRGDWGNEEALKSLRTEKPKLYDKVLKKYKGFL